MKKIRVRVVENCLGNLWWYAICEGRKQLMQNQFGGYERKGNAMRHAKAIANRIGILFDNEIIKLHRC